MIIDCFAGGGGASVGIEMALGRGATIAVNHDPMAILMHKTNHPHTLHLTEDIFEVDLQKYVRGKTVNLMWASPDCTSHSKAKGGKPRCQGLRILPWAIYKHSRKILPQVIIMENVEEIQKWGPLDDTGRPIKEKEGQDYEKFISSMKSLGYAFECRELIAADYGAPTIRKRWYAIFRRDGKPIVWPESSHSPDGKVPGTKEWEPVWKCLDFTDFGKSIFGRRKPLAENTMKRIARGLEKFVINNPNPFIVPIGYGERKGQKPRVNDIRKPLGTIVASGIKHYLCSPVVAPFIDKAYGGNYSGCGSNLKKPAPTITTVDHNRIIAPYFIQYHSETAKNQVRGQYINKPLQTIDTSNRYALMAAFLTKFYKSGTGQSMFEPIHTITTSPGHFGQVSVLMVKMEDLIESNIDTETIERCTWVSQFIIEYYGSGTGQSVKVPLHTVVTKERFALITVLGDEYALVDIRLRMLNPEELKKAQGFPHDYIIDRDYRWHPYPKSEQVKRIGNSVVPMVAEQLVRANVGYLKVGERAYGMNLDVEEDGQIKIAAG